MCSCKFKRSSDIDEDNLQFTEAEVALFETRQKEGYDLTGDLRYNQWLQLVHPRPNSSQTTKTSSRKLRSTVCTKEQTENGHLGVDTVSTQKKGKTKLSDTHKGSTPGE